MGRRAARATHLGLSLLGAILYFLFVIPRWWVLTGDFPAIIGTVGRIAAGFPIAAAAIPVTLTLQRSLKSEEKTPELALRLRAWSAVLHVVAGALLIVTAVVEIWLKLDVAGPWLFAVYGAAGSIAVLGIAAFSLSFIAEEPPAPPKPPKTKKARSQKDKNPRRLGRKRTAAATDEEPTDEEPTDEELADKTGELTGEDIETGDAETDGDPASAEPVDPETGGETSHDASTEEITDTDDASAEEMKDTDDASTAGESSEPQPASGGGLRNLRPGGKRRHRLRR